MFTQKTVFILGAGVSTQYRFQTGRELVSDLARVTSRQEAIDRYGWVSSIGIDPEVVSAMAGALVEAQPASIDAFLEHRLAFQAAGTALMAFQIGSRESPQNLKSEKNCLRLIIDKMTDVSFPPDFCKNQVSFITFNYDRSLEQLLHGVLMARYGLDENTIARWLLGIPIVHVYGQLGYLPWQKSMLREDGPQHELFNESLGERKFETSMPPGNVQIAAAGIQIISQAKEDSPSLMFAQKLIENADNIFILGFGFHRDNMRRLGLTRENPKPLKTLPIGSWQGITNAERSVLQQKYAIDLIGDPGLDAHDFLRNCDLFNRL